MIQRHTRWLAVVALGAAATAILATPAAGAAPTAGTVVPSANQHGDRFPTEFALPTGFLPEGIAIGDRPTAYFGSRADGDIFRVNLATGAGEVISQGPGTPSVGMKLDQRGRLFVSGGPAGDGRVVDVRSGAILASYQFAAAPTFINDVVLTPAGAYFTDSNNAALYHVPVGKRGHLPAQSGVVTIPLGGEWVQNPGFNANGIARTPDGRALIVVNSGTGTLFRVDPANGVATAIDLGGETVVNGDGLLLDGRTLYVVQNQLNAVAVIRLNHRGTVGTVTQRLTDARFDVPTTIARFGDRLYLPNARFGVASPETATYNAVAIPRP
jgi:sugar lactone lactonase YvrE